MNALITSNIVEMHFFRMRRCLLKERAFPYKPLSCLQVFPFCTF